MMSYISSIANPDIKRIVKLHDTKYRKLYAQFIIEGFNANQASINNFILDKLYVTQEKYINAQLIAEPEQIIVVSDHVMKKISTMTTPSGILGVYDIPQAPKFDHLAPGIVLAQISDPGNMGTLIRTAAACNLRNVIIVEGVDPWSPKVIASCAGTISMVNIISLTWKQLLEVKGNAKLCALVVKDGDSINSIEPKNLLLVVSNEAHGLPDDWLNSCDSKITLPMPGGTESLNAAVAGSIAMYLAFVHTF